MPSDITYDDIKDLTHTDLLAIVRDGKIAMAIQNHLDKKSKKVKPKGMTKDMLTPEEFDRIARAALTPEELATMLFDGNNLVSMETTRAPSPRRLDRMLRGR